MTSKERVLDSFAFKQTDRPPCWCGASDEFWSKAKKELNLEDEELLKFLGDDFRRIHSTYSGPTYELPENVTTRTIFGIDREGLGYGHATSHPLENATLDEVENYSWPTADWIDVSNIEKDALQYDNQYAILGGEWSSFWHDSIDLLGMENLYIKMFEAPEIVDAVFGKVTDYYFEANCKIFETASDVIDIFFIGNDFGGQTGPLMGAEQFDRFIIPHLKRLINLGHDYGLKVQMHSCGGIVPLLPLMIDAELDAIHALQPDCRDMNLQNLKKEFGDKIVLNGGIDSHHTLINGDVDMVKDKTKEVLDIMCVNGGYIAGASHDTILEETPVENVVAMFDVIKNYTMK